MLSPLADHTYRYLFAAQVSALLGTGLSTVALTLLAYDLAGGNAGTVLGTALALKMVAYVGIAPIIGGIAHYLPRRRLLIALDLARAAFVLCLPFVTEVWQVYALIFLLNACSAAFTPTFQATIPDVLSEEARYTRALSLSRLAYDLESLLSPTLAAAALLFLTYDALFAVNALAFLISAILVSSVTLPAPKPHGRAGGLWRNLSFGIHAYLATPRLRGLLALSLAVAAAGAMVIVNTVIYVRDYLGGTESATALAFAASGAGSMAVALFLPRLLDRVPDRPVMLLGGVLLALGLILGLLEPGLLALLPVWFLLGVGSSLIQTPAGRLLRRSCHEADRPALFAAQFALSHACWLVTYPLAGWLGAEVGLLPTFVVLSLAVLAATAAAAALWPAHDPAELEHVHEELEHAHPHVHDEHHQHGHEGAEGPEPHGHRHCHGLLRHRHVFVIDEHHRHWPAARGLSGASSVLRRSGAAIVGLLLTAAVGHAQTTRERGGDEILAHAAKIQAMVEVCRQQTPAVAEHVVRTYAEWLERNPVISETLHGLDFGPDPARMEARAAAVAEMKRHEVTALQLALGTDPAGFSIRCERFLKDLDGGELDYPAASAARREEPARARLPQTAPSTR